MSDKKIERKVARQFVLAGQTVEKGAPVKLTPKMEKYLDGLKNSPLVPRPTSKK